MIFLRTDEEIQSTEQNNRTVADIQAVLAYKLSCFFDWGPVCLSCFAFFGCLEFWDVWFAGWLVVWALRLFFSWLGFLKQSAILSEKC
jgi:hypothetical protein